MTIETAIRRLKDANPAPETSLLRSETDDLTTLLHATWQRSTNVQTQQAQKFNPEKEPRKNGWLIAAAVAAVTIIVIGAVALLPLSQGSNDVTDTPQTTLNTAPPTTTAAPQSGPTTHEVEAFDYGFSGLPAELRAGDAIEFANTSSTEYHNLVVIRLDDGDNRTTEDFAVLDPEVFGLETAPPAGYTLVGGLHAAPGEAAFDGRIRLQVPGRYLVIDVVPQGADPAVVAETVNPASSSDSGGTPYRIAGGPLGYQHGMIAIVTVTAK
jgi:plastocyanin